MGWQGARADLGPRPSHAHCRTVTAMTQGHADGATGRAGRKPGAGSRPGWLASACAWMLLLMVVAGCSRPDPEVALRESVAGLQAAIEQRDPAAMQQQLADDFIGNDGLDRDGARRMAALLLMRHRDIGIDTGPLQLELAGEHAVVRFTAMLRGGSGRLLPDAARVYEVETGWRMEHGEWRLTSARWSPVLSGR